MELIVYVAVFSIFMYVTTSIFTSVLDVQVESDTTSIIQQDSRFIVERLTYDIHRADDIVVPSETGMQTSSLQLDIGGETYTYSLNSGNLELSNNSGTHQLNSTGSAFLNISFLRIGNTGGNHSIVIDFNLDSQAKLRGQPEQIHVHTAVATR